MRYLKNKPFERALRSNGLDDEDVKIVLDDIFEGRAVPLGAKLYKIRGAREGKGKSGGFRSLFFWKKDELIVFCLLFPKNARDNISSDAYKTLRILSEVYENLTEDDIKMEIEMNNLTEIRYEKEQ